MPFPEKTKRKRNKKKNLRKSSSYRRMIVEVVTRVLDVIEKRSQKKHNSRKRSRSSSSSSSNESSISSKTSVSDSSSSSSSSSTDSGFRRDSQSRNCDPPRHSHTKRKKSAKSKAIGSTCRDHRAGNITVKEEVKTDVSTSSSTDHGKLPHNAVSNQSAFPKVMIEPTTIAARNKIVVDEVSNSHLDNDKDFDQNNVVKPLDDLAESRATATTNFKSSSKRNSDSESETDHSSSKNIRSDSAWEVDEGRKRTSMGPRGSKKSSTQKSLPENLTRNLRSMTLRVKNPPLPRQCSNDEGLCIPSTSGMNRATRRSKKFKCIMEDNSQCLHPGCNEVFRCKRFATSHYNTNHIGVRYACLHCEKVYTRNATLKVHIQKNHGDF